MQKSARASSLAGTRLKIKTDVSSSYWSWLRDVSCIRTGILLGVRTCTSGWRNPSIGLGSHAASRESLSSQILVTTAELKLATTPPGSPSPPRGIFREGLTQTQRSLILGLHFCVKFPQGLQLLVPIQGCPFDLTVHCLA